MSSRRAYREGIEDFDFVDDEVFEEPPLYPNGHLAGLNDEQLEAEQSRQAHRQGSLGDAEVIDERAVELAEARWRACDNERRCRETARAA